MRVLVIGGTRFLGIELVFGLLFAGHNVTILNRGTRPDPFGPRVERLVADRTTPRFTEILRGREFDAVIDLAAYTEHDVRTACSTLLGSTAHYIFISTGQVYLVREGYRGPAREIDYEGPVIPQPNDDAALAEWLYGMQKRAAEDVLQAAFRDLGFPVTSLRIPMVNGSLDYKKRIEGYFYRMLDNGPILLAHGDEERKARHIWSGSLVRAIVKILGRKDTFGQAYNLCQDEMPTTLELILELREALGSKSEVVLASLEDLKGASLDLKQVSPFSSRWMSCLDNTKAKRELSFEHAPLRTYLAAILNALTSHFPDMPPPGYESRRSEIRLAGALRRSV